MGLILNWNFCFEVNGRFDTTWMVTLYNANLECVYLPSMLTNSNPWSAVRSLQEQRDFGGTQRWPCDVSTRHPSAGSIALIAGGKIFRMGMPSIVHPKVIQFWIRTWHEVRYAGSHMQMQLTNSEEKRRRGQRHFWLPELLLQLEGASNQKSKRTELGTGTL